MNSIRETLLDLLLNASLQIGLFAIIAASFSRLLAKARPKYQYVIYLAVFLVCITAPVVNTFWKSHPTAVAEHSPPQIPSEFGALHHRFWSWQGQSTGHGHFALGRPVQVWIIGIWGLLVLYRLARFGLGVHRVYRLRRDASVLSPEVAGMAACIIDASHRVTLLESAAIGSPATMGIFHPFILLPRKVLPQLDEQELMAVLAHEYAHIRRRDFPVHILSELISLPVRWHPGICYLLSRISQTRELACDDAATDQLGTRRPYANALLRLASLCLPVSGSNAAELGIFDGENLEDRIMMLTEKKLSLSRVGITGLVLAMAITFGASAVLARAMSWQASSKISNPAEKFAGTWHWMFNKKSFVTMILVWDGSRFTGSVTGSRIALNDDGTLSRADPSENSTPSPINYAKLEGSALHVTVKDGDEIFEFTVTLKDETHAEIHPTGAPANMKPIPAEKVH
jgi:beta-lactamase regulating signal transducer with metallopeptidase domain